MNFSAQTNTVCGNALCLRQWGGAWVIMAINDDNSQTPCMRRKAAWLLASRYIHIKKYTLSFIYKFLSLHTRKTPPYKTPVFCLRYSKNGSNSAPELSQCLYSKNK